ncbi:MAG: twin-arginine translocase subunit TatB [Methylophilaceae bacterium]|nr:twin-arginine translocase subunit TatB [Methylophilaceae bacterium]
MFDFSFAELMVIGVVALIVIGPEKLPRVARTMGLLAGKLQRYVSNVKTDISREMQLEDLKKLEEEIKQAQLSFDQQVREVKNVIEAPSGAGATEAEALIAAEPAPEKSPAETKL